MRAVLLVHAAAAWTMVGVVWFVQVVHYPLFERVEALDRYARENVVRTALLAGPAMAVEAAAALVLALRRPRWVPAWQPWAGLALLAAALASTALVQFPIHLELGRGRGDVGTLVWSNWIRTAAWTLRGGLAVWMLQRPAHSS